MRAKPTIAAPKRVKKRSTPTTRVAASAVVRADSPLSKARLRDDFRNYARAAILAAAEQVFADDGLHEARIEKIAERARVAVGTIYNLVGDREALVAEIIGARHAELVALM